jgi:hypothetical protein
VGLVELDFAFLVVHFDQKIIKGGLEDGNRIKGVYIFFNLLIFVLWIYLESMVSSNPYMYM